MIEIVCHCGDVHIMKDSRHDEYRRVFNEFYKKLNEIKPDRIVVNGDTWNDFTDIRSEGFILMGEFLNRLSSISKVIITKGNHDFSRKNLNKIDTIKSITTILNNNNIIYYDKTGFYEDDNIVWAVWDNADRGNPWKLNNVKKEPDKTYIDLYHDPIENVKLYNGITLNKKNMPSVGDLLGDISMLNDIHLHQTFSNGTKSFSSSLIQQNYGESVNGHGFLKWFIKDRKFEFIELQNDHAFIKFNIDPNTNYDKLNLFSNHVGVFNEFRVEWNEYAAFVTNENEHKIRKHIKDRYDADHIEIDIKRIYTDIKEGKMLSEVLDINDKNVQQKIIKEYLKENKFDDNFIQEIIDVDNLINDRLQLSDTKNVIWTIDKFWFNNFKSYGDDNIIEWDNIDGIIQIGGENQQGKSTIIDAICFILYGTTLATTKTEKNGNNRYINKNRDLNYCDGGAILNVNGEKYIMYRKVEREFKKGKEIKSVPMILDYYKGTEMNEESKLTGERRSSTQKLLDEVLGNFDDFIRMALTNADNLNSLLSMDRSVFIDSIIRDAGYDIFEKKLSEFKEYKKEMNYDKISVNQIELQNEIKRISIDLKDNKDYFSDTEIELNEIDLTLKEQNILKENLLIGINTIDKEVININVDEVKGIIDELSFDKDRVQDSFNKLNIDIDGLPTSFDEDNFERLNNQYSKYTTEKSKRDIEILQLNNLYRQNEDKIKNVDKDINIEKTKYIDYLRNNIAGLKIELRETINEINNNSNSKKNAIDTQKLTLKNEIFNLKQNGLTEKKNISDYQNMLNGDNQVCITCHQLILSKDEEHMNGLINESTKKIEEISKKGKIKIESLNECNLKLESLNQLTDRLIEDKKKEFENKINDIQYKVDNFNVSYIQDRIEEVMKNKSNAEFENESLSEKIEERKIYLDKLDIEIKKLEKNISDLKSNKILFEKYKTLSINKERLNSKIKDIQRSYLDNTRLLSEYLKSESMIKENNRIQNELNKIKMDMDNLTSKRVILNNNKLSYSNQITLLSKVLKDLEDKLQKYVEQEKREELHGVYLKLMHRTGLPTYLLTKNINILNNELNSLLTNLNFTLFFDEDLNLKLQHDGLDGVINCIEASGAERVFSSVVLKMVLRIINFKSKPNILFMDEILNKCVGKTIDRFMELLETLKSKINKIIIIEHNVEIPSDLIISVNKGIDGVSSFEII